MNIAISVSNLSKRYSIDHAGSSGYHTLKDEISSGLKRLIGLNTRPKKAASEEFWAVDHIDFEVKQGERLGIIGRNGAGKSTLLKILSKVVEPTTGKIEILGRLSSLLEVGTGFHPELTGRENVYLNGAILGMSRSEIGKKFDEIVDFSGVERFIDMPVKHYSSGMYMRLAFAVAANLDPDILLIDEVLAVGDLAFQQKCLGKIESITNTGRTVLFVSHSLSSITSLCTSAILLDAGKIVASGDVSDVIMKYYGEGKETSTASFDFTQNRRYIGSEYAFLLAGAVRNQLGTVSTEVDISEPIVVEMEFEIRRPHHGPFIANFHFKTADGSVAFISHDPNQIVVGPGRYKVRCNIPGNLLNEGTYFVGLALTTYSMGITVHFYEQGIISFNVRDPIVDVKSRGSWAGSIPGSVRPNLNWETEKLS